MVMGSKECKENPSFRALFLLQRQEWTVMIYTDAVKITDPTGVSGDVNQSGWFC